MKFSAILIASLSASTSAFAPPSRITNNINVLSAATLEAPSAEETSSTPQPPKVEATAVEEAVSTDMAVEKDWPVDIVKDSDRVMP